MLAFLRQILELYYNESVVGSAAHRSLLVVILQPGLLAITNRTENEMIYEASACKRHERCIFLPKSQGLVWFGFGISHDQSSHLYLSFKNISGALTTL